MLTRERKVRARLGSDERQQHVAAARACVRFAFEIALALARVMMMIRSALFRSCKINRVTEVRNTPADFKSAACAAMIAIPRSPYEASGRKEGWRRCLGSACARPESGKSLRERERWLAGTPRRWGRGFRALGIAVAARTPRISMVEGCDTFPLRLVVLI